MDYMSLSAGAVGGSRANMEVKLIVFTIFECFILSLNLIFISLIYLYIRKFGLKVLDKYILSSFFILAFALTMRSSINLANYTMGFEYIEKNPQDDGQEY